MAFLERNLEQLMHVQRQLVEQNSGLKKEVAIAERKLIARNERIQSLEGLLQDSQEKLTAANHRHVPDCTHWRLGLLTMALQVRDTTHSRQRPPRGCQGWNQGAGKPGTVQLPGKQNCKAAPRRRNPWRRNASSPRSLGRGGQFGAAGGPAEQEEFVVL